MRVGAVAAVAVAILAVIPASSAAAPALKRCADDRSARCGSVGVPLLRGAPGGGGRLRVRFRVYPRTTPSSSTGPRSGRWPATRPGIAAPAPCTHG